jgi:hypothetical protein
MFEFCGYLFKIIEQLKETNLQPNMDKNNLNHTFLVTRCIPFYLG